MRTLSCIVAVALCASAAPAWAQRVTNPDWLTKPSGEDMAEHYPKLATMLDLEGKVSLSCEVDVRGLLQRCTVVSESPAGLGFGAAGLAMAQNFRMIPKTVDGKPVSGGTVRIPLNFRLPKTPAEPPAEKLAGAEIFGPPSPHALELAGKIVQAQSTLSQYRVEFEVALMPLADLKLPGVDEKTRDDTLAAMRAGFDAYVQFEEKAMAQSYATTFSEAELVQIEAFVTSPVGRAVAARQPGMMEARKRRAYGAQRMITETARTVFCAQHACSPDGATAPPAP